MAPQIVFEKGKKIQGEMELFTEVYEGVAAEFKADPTKFGPDGRGAAAEVAKRMQALVGGDLVTPQAVLTRATNYNKKLAAYGVSLPKLPNPPSNKPKAEGSTGKKGPQIVMGGMLARLAAARGMTVEQLTASGNVTETETVSE